MSLEGDGVPGQPARFATDPAALLVVGANHRTAPIEARERLLRLVTYPRLRAAAGTRPPWDDLILLATCNRIEAFALTNRREAALRALRKTFALPLEGPRVYVLDGEDAAAHLFRVASGLDSLAQGEGQITTQVRRAPDDRPARWKKRPGLASLFSHAARAAPRIRGLAGVTEDGTSAGHAAVRFVRQVVPLARPRVLLLGTGKMARIGAGALRGRADLVVLNRDASKARTVAQELGGRGGSMARLSSELARADVVIAATSTRKPLVTRALLARASEGRGGRAIWLIDLGFPRNVDVRCATLDGVTLVDIDALAPWGGQPLPPPAQARADAAIRDEARRAVEALSPRASLDVAIFRRAAEALRRDEVERALSRLPSLSESDRAVVDKLATRLVNRFLHAPTERLRSLPDGAREELVRELVDGLQEAGGAAR